MADNKRILAVEIDNELFDKLSDLVKKEGVSKKQYVAELIKNHIEQKLKQQQVIKEPEITGQKLWDREEVEKAIDDFILKNNRVPTQKDFKNENGLPSYGAASRALEASASQYANNRMQQLADMQFADCNFDIGPAINM